MNPTKETLQALTKALKTSGYVIIADGIHTRYDRMCKALLLDINSMGAGPAPRICKNFLGNLLVDYDNV
jgi:hypothetical protein